MLIYFLVLIGLSAAQQQLCYKGPGDLYSGTINVTRKGDPCEQWAEQKLIILDDAVDHNFCRVFQNMSSSPYCVYKGQKQSCDIPTCDPSTLLFQGSNFLFFRNSTNQPSYPVVAQQINFYFKQDEDVATSGEGQSATLVQIKSRSGNKQHVSVMLVNRFLKLVVSLDSYNSEQFVFGGPISYGDVHYVSVNRTRSLLFVQLNDTISNYTLTSKDTEFLVSPYQVMVGDNYYGCMTGLSIGTWLQTSQGDVKFLSDRPFPLYDGSEIKQFTIRNAKTGTPRGEQCMFAPTTFVQNSYVQERSPDPLITENPAEAAVEVTPKRGMLDRRSIIIISVALGVIFTLTLVTLICVKRNQDYSPRGYNLEVM